MTTPGPAGYLPPALAVELRAALAGIGDRPTRVRLIELAEAAHQHGYGEGYARGVPDGRAEAQAEMQAQQGGLDILSRPSQRWEPPPPEPANGAARAAVAVGGGPS